MFGFFTPTEEIEFDLELDQSADDVIIGSIWKDTKDDSLWRITYLDRWVHVMNISSSEVCEHGINMFLVSFSVVEYGAICSSCKKEYQYAEKRYNFECWACKNGA